MWRWWQTLSANLWKPQDVLLLGMWLAAMYVTHDIPSKTLRYLLGSCVNEQKPVRQMKVLCFIKLANIILRCWLWVSWNSIIDVHGSIWSDSNPSEFNAEGLHVASSCSCYSLSDILLLMALCWALLRKTASAANDLRSRKPGRVRQIERAGSDQNNLHCFLSPFQDNWKMDREAQADDRRKTYCFDDSPAVRSGESTLPNNKRS